MSAEKAKEKIDLKIAHWCMFAPGRSGMYETVKELVLAENDMPGVLAGIVDPDKGQEAGGREDGWIKTQSHGWAYEEANVQVCHYFFTGYATRQKPRIFVTHGTPEACLDAEERHGSFTACMDAVNEYDAVVTMLRRHEWFWKQFGTNVYYIPKGVDLTRRWLPKGIQMDLNGAPKILYGEVWRGIKNPILALYAVDEYYKLNNEVKLHLFGAEEQRDLINRILIQGRFIKFLGRFGLGGRQLWPEQWYRSGDMLISPVLMGEPSRMQKEALACGCPVVTWDTDPFPDNWGFYKAKAFDTHSLAECVGKLWDDIQRNRGAVRKKARLIAETHYDMRVMARKFVEIVRMVVNKY